MFNLKVHINRDVNGEKCYQHRASEASFTFADSVYGSTICYDLSLMRVTDNMNLFTEAKITRIYV